VKAKILTIDSNIPVTRDLKLQPPGGVRVKKCKKGYDPFFTPQYQKWGRTPFLRLRQAGRLAGLVPKERPGSYNPLNEYLSFELWLDRGGRDEAEA
jgi:hypothetical protein